MGGSGSPIVGRRLRAAHHLLRCSFPSTSYAFFIRSRREHSMNDDLPPVRWGVLGAANIALAKVIPAMMRSATSRVVAIASRDESRATAAAKALGIPRAYGSYEALLADPEIDAI